MTHDPALMKELVLSGVVIVATMFVVGYALFYMYKKSNTK